MANITCACGAGVAMSPFPCKATDYGFPSKLLVMSDKGTMTVAGETPTLAEVQAAIALTTVNRLIVIEELTNGKRVEANREEESGADTADGLTNTFGINMAIQGNIKLLDETIRAELAALNCHQRLKVWVVTNKGYILGGKTGYRVANFIPPMTLDGFGTRAYIPVNFVYAHNLNADEPASQNDSFLTLVNPTP